MFYKSGDDSGRGVAVLDMTLAGAGAICAVLQVQNLNRRCYGERAWNGGEM
jgi:hypothetical protein